MTPLIVGPIVLLVVLLFLVPAWIVLRDPRSGRSDPEVD
jgi:hypothetical protein